MPLSVHHLKTRKVLVVSEAEERLRQGKLFRQGLIGESELLAAADLITRVQVEKFETIRIVFADPHGILRGKTIVAEALVSAFCDGMRVPSTLLLKDTSHRTAFPVWSEQGDAPMQGASDVVLVPVASTFRALPWSTHSALLHCSVALPTGEPVHLSSRHVLAQAVRQMESAGLAALMGLEVEFQVYSVINPSLEHSDTSMPALPPQTRALTQGYQYLTETRYGEVESLLDQLRRFAQAMAMPVRSVEIEMGPSQFEFTFAPADPMSIADMAVTFRTLVKEVCHRQGLHATFMAKPRLPNAAANGWHIHQSIQDADSGRNLFAADEPGVMSPTARHWIAGLLEHAAASCLLTAPTVNSYKRFTSYQLAPTRIGWGTDNRGAMVRALLDENDHACRIENRVADSSANPYFALASQLTAGMDGMERQLEAPSPLSSPYDNDAPMIPGDLQSAIDAFAASTHYRDRIGTDFVDYLTVLKRAEWNRYIGSVSEWEQAEYFSAF